MQDVQVTRLLTSPGVDALNRSPGQLLQKAGPGTGENAARLQEASREFEALFLGYMLNVMRESVEESDRAGGGLGKSIYTELFDQELARSLAGRSALGIADMLVRNLTDRQRASEPGAGNLTVPVAPSPVEAGKKDGEVEEVPDFRMPVQAHLSSGFGIRKDPLTQEMRFHRGVDISAPAGMGVHAAAAGLVVFSGFEKGYGNTVVIQHPGGFETRYAHMGTLQAKVGDMLQAEQVLGTVGSTGRSTGPHLHFEVSRHGGMIDPTALVDE